MLGESSLQRQSYHTATPFICVCSQCAADLDTQHPHSSNMCTRCSSRFKDPHPGGRMRVVGDGCKSDQAQRPHPPDFDQKSSSLHIPRISRKSVSFPAKRNMQSLNSLRSFVTSDDTQADATEAHPLDDLKYPDDPFTVDSVTQTSSTCGTGPFSTVSPEHQSRLIYSKPVPLHPDFTPQVTRHEADFTESHQSSVIDGEPSSLWTIKPLSPPSHIHHSIRICSTKGCAGLIVPSSTCHRCVKCIKAEWNIRRPKLSAPKPSLSSPVSILRTDSPDKGKRKSVSWADQQHNRSHLSRDSQDNWISKIKRVHLKLPEPPLPSPDSDALVDERSLKATRFYLKLQSLDEPLSPVSNAIPDELNLFPCSPPILQYTDSDSSLLGDSDPSELTDTSGEESESESDESSSRFASLSRRSDFEPKVAGTPSKLVIRIPARYPSTTASSGSTSHQALSPNPTPSPYARCADAKCYRYLPPNRLERLCMWCFLRQMHRDEKLVPRDQSSISQQVYSDNIPKPAESPTIMELISRELLSGDVVPGARLCTACQHIMPPHSQYLFHDCCFCRTKAQLKRSRELRRNGTALGSDNEATVVATMVQENTVSKPPTGRCQNLDCGVVVQGFSECWQCTSRRLGKWRQRGKTRGEFSTSVSGHNPGKLTKGSFEAPSCTEKGVQRSLNLFTPYPEYRCQHELLADFHMRISAFFQAQLIYSLYMPRDAREVSVFGFDGQFSVVALDFDLLGRREAVESTVSNLKGELQRLGSLHFDTDKTLTTNESGIFTHYLCFHRRYNPFGPPYPDQKPTLMQGELEVAVLPDRSHSFLPGQKTIVRFFLVG